MDISNHIGFKDRFEDKPEIEYDSMDEYLKAAKKLIQSLAPRYRVGLAEEMLRDDEAVSNVATDLMIADYKWNGKGTRPGWRKQYASYSILSYMTRAKKRIKTRTWSLDYPVGMDDEGACLSDIVKDHRPGPAEEVENKETSEMIDDLLAFGVLSEQQEKCIRLHYLFSMKQSHIAKQEGISREAVRQNICRGMNKLNEMAENV